MRETVPCTNSKLQARRKCEEIAQLLYDIMRCSSASGSSPSTPSLVATLSRPLHAW